MDQMSKNLGNCKGPTPRRSDPMQWPRPTPRRGMPRRGVAERRIWPTSGTQQSSNATPRCSTVHSMTNFGVLFCFVFSLFRGLV